VRNNLKDLRTLDENNSHHEKDLNSEVENDMIASVKAYRKNSFNNKLAKMSTVD